MPSFFVFSGSGTITKFKANFLCVGLGGLIDSGGFF